jgi:hypothetical protein
MNENLYVNNSSENFEIFNFETYKKITCAKKFSLKYSESTA